MESFRYPSCIQSCIRKYYRSSIKNDYRVFSTSFSEIRPEMSRRIPLEIFLWVSSVFFFKSLQVLPQKKFWYRPFLKFLQELLRYSALMFSEIPPALFYMNFFRNYSLDFLRNCSMVAFRKLSWDLFNKIIHGILVQKSLQKFLQWFPQ